MQRIKKLFRKKGSEREGLLTSKHSEYSSIHFSDVRPYLPSTLIGKDDRAVFTNANSIVINSERTDSIDEPLDLTIKVKHLPHYKLSFRCFVNTIDGGIFMIKNYTSSIDISKFYPDQRLQFRYLVDKKNVAWIRKSEESDGERGTEYVITIALFDDEKISTRFIANEAILIYNFIKLCLKKYNTVEN